MKVTTTTESSCKSCGRTDVPHKAAGLCRKCWYREYMRAYMRGRRKKGGSQKGA